MPEQHAHLSPEDQVDLTNCDREPIHLLGRVQTFSALLAVTSDWNVAHASMNSAAILGHDASAIIGAQFTALFPGDVVHFLRSKMQLMGRDDSAVRVFGHALFEDERLFDVSIHGIGSFYVFEFERHLSKAGDEDVMSMVQPLISRVQSKQTVEAACQQAARGLKALSGIDRVMVYRFEPDGSGTVIAEAKEPSMDPFHGLRYPASDVPKQARALYERQLLRIIADVDDPTHAIIPERSSDGQPLDLSLAVSRAVSPIHLEYLRNMGVAASMSVSILRRGKLWGLFACHHNSVFEIDYQRRSAIELFAQMFAYELSQIESEAEFEDIAKADRLHDALIQLLSNGMDLNRGFEQIADLIGEVIHFDGIGLYSNETYRSVGAAPKVTEFRELQKFLNTTPTSAVFHTNSIASRFPAAEFEEDIAGVLAIPISKAPRDYVLLFRREIARSVKWAGDPNKPVEVGPNGVRLTPRKSFEAWQEIVKDTAEDWRATDLRCAEALRITLLEVVLKLTNDAIEGRKRAQERQELLIAELNHRVRNILNLIRGLVGQGKGEAATVSEYSAILDTRIHALARAHDQLTDENWGSVKIERLIRNEVEGFVAGNAHRVNITGDSLALQPTAFTAMALVFHELLTNSVKYGALANDAGRVDIEIRKSPGGSALISWQEREGPTVVPPTRKGFGTTVIERSVPFELKGKAELIFASSGVEARFEIPKSMVDEVEGEAQITSADVAAPGAGTGLSGNVLVLDDNLIIAMDTSDILKQLGAEETVAVGSVFDALAALEENTFQLLLLDINLGTETSLEVADYAVKNGIPCILATGYNASDKMLAEYPDLPLLKKPFTDLQIQQVIQKMQADGQL